jgi:glycosyltransferase involved in cell wall biosynthesis
MNDIKISIITITFNSEKTVEETINSIISQNYSNIEYIIVDGGSTDKTLEIVNKYQDKISKIISERDEGISDAFNKGIRVATGDIIGIINSDDILLPSALTILAENFASDVDVYRGNTIIWNDITSLKIREIPSMRFPVLHFFLNVSHQSTFITRQAYNRFGVYDIRLKYMMDVDILTRLYKSRAKFKYINFDYTLYRMGGVTASSIWRKYYEVQRYIKNNNGSYITFIIYYILKVAVFYIKKILNFFGANTSKLLRAKVKFMGHVELGN